MQKEGRKQKKRETKKKQKQKQNKTKQQQQQQNITAHGSSVCSVKHTDLRPRYSCSLHNTGVIKLPSHVKPSMSSVKPSTHEQLYPPMVLMHLCLHLFLSMAHSSTSATQYFFFQQ